MCITLLVGLTYAECQVKQSHPDIQSEEQDHIGHFAEEDNVAHMLLHGYWHEPNTETFHVFVEMPQNGMN